MAEGAGQALAAPMVQGTLKEEQDQTFALQEKLIKQIRANKQAGKDTSRLEKALKQSYGMVDILNDANKDFEESLVSNKEVVGSALRLGATAGAGQIVGLGAKAAGLGKATGIVSGALRGAGAGAISGAGMGAIQGAGLGLEGNKTAGEIAQESAVGALSGGAVGGALGLVTGGVMGGLKGRKIANENFAKDFTTPKMSAKEKAQALYQGRLKDPTLLNKAEVELSKHDETIADSVKDVINRKASLAENIDAIKYKITQTDKGVANYISKNKSLFNGKQLRSALETGKEDLDLIFASDTSAEKTYNAVADAFMKNVSQKDTLGLFEARKTFDQLPAIKKLLQSDKLGENARKEIVLAVRRAANEYIASKLPVGNLYRSTLLNESNMIEALGNIAEKNAGIIGKNNLQLLAQKYPLLKWIVGSSVGGAISGGLIGGAIIGSTD